ncbi:MAG TPA: hypothetical protein VHC48_19950 [Puia sp.]|nr:hypothetical protein [Puia sp.]
MIYLPHIAHEQTHPDVERPYLPLLVVRPADVHRFPIRSYGIALLPDTSASIKPALDTLIQGDRPFLVILDAPDKYDGDLFEYITLCLFSPNYIRIGEAPVIAFHSSPPAALITRLQQQGWSDIVEWNVPFIRRLTQRHEIPDMTDSLLTGTSLSKYIFIHGKDLDDTLNLEQSLHRYCSDMLNDNPPLRTLVLQKQKMQERLDILEKESRTLRERLHNTETTVGIIRNKYKDDYDILFSWYQKEYEVLPLWYKRVGHLIKVLTGKRSAKSLFHSIHRRIHRWRIIRPKKTTP